MKACDGCGATGSWESRMLISDIYKQKPMAYKLVCILLIYMPLISLSFVVLSAVLTTINLTILGAKDLKPYQSYLPSRKSHRYDLKSQVTMESNFPLNPIRTKLFWVANCTWYCPYSVALFEWHAYLVKLLANVKTGKQNEASKRGQADRQIDIVQKGKAVVFNLVSVLLTCLLLLGLPFVIFSATMTILHLKMAGALTIRPYRSFLPENEANLSELKGQATMVSGSWFSPMRSKSFGFSNNSGYWAYGVALFEWHAYLVKLVENWWCPFHHDRKDSHYREGAISQSFWHLYPEDLLKLDPEDRNNPLWNAPEDH